MIVTIKRGIALLSITFLMLLSPFLSTLAKAEGDANNDGMVTSADITCVILGIFGMPCPMPDCNDDGSVTSADITCVILDIFSDGPQINKFVSIGDSLTGGVQSGGLVREFQENSFPFFIAQQLGIDDFEQPLIGSPGVGASLGRTPLMFENGEIFDEPLLVINPFDLLINFPLGRSYDNLGVPGAQLFDVDSTAGLIEQFVLQGMGSQLDQAIGLDPDLVSIWIGSNDVLGAAVFGGELDRITPQDDFRAEYENILQELTENTTAMIVVANVPNVTDIPFVNHLDRIFRGIPALGIFEPVPVVFDENFDPVDIGGGTFIPLLTDETDVVHLLLPAAELYRDSGIGIPDEAALMDLGFDPISAGAIVSGLEDAGLQASGIPFGGGFTLTTSEEDSIQVAVDGFNNTIVDLAAEFSIPVADINQELSILNNTGIDGYSGDFVLIDVENTAFSLDGIHPNNGGHAITANTFIEVINQAFGLNIPLLDSDEFRGQYLN